MKGKYFIPDYEGVKTLLFGDYMQYDPTKSPFVNLFDISHADPAEHFIRICILHYLSKIPDNNNSNTYTKVSDFIKYLATLGYSYGLSIDILKGLLDKNYINRVVEKDTISNEDMIKISSLGRYHIFILIFEFQYLDAAIIDTPILDDKIRENIKDVSQINDRLDRTQNFLTYLSSAIEIINDKEIKLLWKGIFALAKEKIAEIRARN